MVKHSLIRILLLPFSWLYAAGVYLRNKQFDLEIRKSVSFSIPLIVIGNLSTGGTGKTPMIEYLLRRLQPAGKLGVLSRGYKRKSKGFLMLDKNSLADQAGDEPLQMKQKFPQVIVAVSESRSLGVATMLFEEPGLNIIMLDDAFQHRQIKAGFSVLLTEYVKLFSRDMLLPAGTLREPVNGAKRAQAIVVTKCPPILAEEEKERLKLELKAFKDQPVFFSALQYGEPYEITGSGKIRTIVNGDQILLFCGIANPDPLVSYLTGQSAKVQLQRYADHHKYTLHDLKRISDRFESIKGERKLIITTEKDAVKLIVFEEFIRSQQMEIYCIPVEVIFLGRDGIMFDNLIASYLAQAEQVGTPSEFQ